MKEIALMSVALILLALGGAAGEPDPRLALESPALPAGLMNR